MKTTAIKIETDLEGTIYSFNVLSDNNTVINTHFAVVDSNAEESVVYFSSSLDGVRASYKTIKSANKAHDYALNYLLKMKAQDKFNHSKN